jgi:integrase
MAQSQKFPITIKAGATAIKIYRSPLKVAQEGKAKLAKFYDSFVLSYYQLGQRKRFRFNDLDEAKLEADRIRTLVMNEDLSALQLTGRDRMVFIRANEIAKAVNRSLDVLAKEFQEAQTILGSVSIMEAVHFYERFGKSIREKRTVPQVVAELMEGLRADKRSEYHVRDMEARLKAFAEFFPGQILELRTTDVDKWLRGLSWVDQKDQVQSMSSKTRNHYRNAVVQLFNFARDHGYLARGLPTEAEAVKTVDVVVSENEIFTIEEMERLLSDVREELIPALTIKAFSGIRTEEMLRIKWENINFETQHITISSDIAKTKQRRIIPMSKNLVAWLTPFKNSKGRICPQWKRPQAMFQAFDRHGKRLGTNVGANKFRNSYISYRVALTHDVQRVALESGNSPKIIQREYLELATENDGKRWFGIFPKV